MTDPTMLIGLAEQIEGGRLVGENVVQNVSPVERGVAMLLRLAAALPPANDDVQPRRWRHKKRGSTYVEVSREYAGRAADERRPDSASPWSGIAGDFAKIQGRIHRGERVVFYRTETDGTLWCRAEREFMDGRFEELTPAPEVALAEVKAELEQKREECSLIENRLTDALAAERNENRRLTAERDRLAEVLQGLRDGQGLQPGTTIESILSSFSAPEQPAEPSEAARDVLAERRRQVEVEGWTPDHDDGYAKGEIAKAAAIYAEWAGAIRGFRGAPLGWPWSAHWWKPKGQRRDLVRAGALIIAEIERLDRASLAQTEPEKERRP